MRKGVKCGGDTDTNAKIVGNIFGAYYDNCIPTYMSTPVLQFNSESPNKHLFKRPYIYSIQHGIQLINELKSIVNKC